MSVRGRVQGRLHWEKSKRRICLAHPPSETQIAPQPSPTHLPSEKPEHSARSTAGAASEPLLSKPGGGGRRGV